MHDDGVFPHCIHHSRVDVVDAPARLVLVEPVAEPFLLDARLVKDVNLGRDAE